MKPKFNDNQVKEMANRFKNKESINAIAKSMKTTAATVTKYLKKTGVYRRRRKINIGKKKQAVVKSRSLGQIINQLKQAEVDFTSLKKDLAQALIKQEKKIKCLKNAVKPATL